MNQPVNRILSTLKTHWPYAVAGAAGLGLAGYMTRKIRARQRGNAAIADLMAYSRGFDANKERIFAEVQRNPDRFFNRRMR
jgi:hypothetical protein